MRQCQPPGGPENEPRRNVLPMAWLSCQEWAVPMHLVQLRDSIRTRHEPSLPLLGQRRAVGLEPRAPGTGIVSQVLARDLLQGFGVGPGVPGVRLLEAHENEIDPFAPFEDAQARGRTAVVEAVVLDR